MNSNLPQAASGETSSAQQEIVLVAERLTKHYPVSRGWFRSGLVKALNGVSFSLARGRTLAVVGESGCGKSTLARQLTMIEAPTSGSLFIDGRDVAHDTHAAAKALRRPRTLEAFLARTKEPDFAAEVRARVQASRAASEEARDLGDETLVTLAYEVLAGN